MFFDRCFYLSAYLNAGLQGSCPPQRSQHTIGRLRRRPEAARVPAVLSQGFDENKDNKKGKTKLDRSSCPRNSCMISVVGYFFLGVMQAQEFTHRTAQTNINGDKQGEVVRVNASHIQFARNDLGSLVWSSLHQTQPSFTDYTIFKFLARNLHSF